MIVTHNIEEAVLLADRVVVLGTNPGHILAELPIELARPRDRRSPSFEALVDKVYGLLTGTGPATALIESASATPTSHPLPRATVGGLAGLVEIVYGKGGRADIPDIAADLSIDTKDLLPLVDAAALLDFLHVSGADLELTLIGKDFTTANIQTSKQIFAQQAQHPRTAGAHHLQRATRLPRRQPAGRFLPRHSSPGVQRPRRATTTPHRYQLGLTPNSSTTTPYPPDHREPNVVLLTAAHTCQVAPAAVRGLCCPASMQPEPLGVKDLMRPGHWRWETCCFTVFHPLVIWRLGWALKSRIGHHARTVGCVCRRVDR